MSKSYGQFCPVAQAAEILAERWTPLVIRELLAGSRRFNEIHRGVPLISPSLLSQRLRTLEDAELVERRKAEDGASDYHLTQAGLELEPVIAGLGKWGKRWARREVRPEEHDPNLLMWDLHRRLRMDRFPNRRIVVHFELTDVSTKQRFYWLVIEDGSVDICMKDPGFEVNLYVTGELRTLTSVWVGDMSLDQAIRQDSIRFSGPRGLSRSFKSSLMLSVFANVERARKSDRVHQG